MRFSDAEWKVMKVMWERDRERPATVRDVFEALRSETGWAYSTVRTILTRLADKGAVTMHKRARTSLFAPQVTAEEARRSALRALLERAFDGTFGALAHHLLAAEKLSTAEREELRRLLTEAAQREPDEGEP